MYSGQYQGGAMAQPRTLYNMQDLTDSGFGRLYPRHGLQLLYWFTRDFINFDCDNEIQTRFLPSGGKFGFHRFQNRLDNYSIPLLPEGGYTYYEVGNLHLPASSDLPPYVRERFSSRLNGCNKDRIIINMCQGRQVDRVYVTQHDDPKSFDRENTFRINRDLLKYISKVTVLGDFLREAGYIQIRQQSYSQGLQGQPGSQGSGGLWDYCTIL